MSGEPPPAPRPDVWAGNTSLREWLITLTIFGGVLFVFVAGLAVATRNVPYFSDCVFWLSLAGAMYSWGLAFRARRLSGRRLRRAWRNVLLMIALSVLGVTAVVLTHEHHRRFWRWATPDLAHEWRP